MIDSFFHDLKFGARMLRRNPGFTAMAVLTLALGIGANTAIFSVVKAVLLQPLPYLHPEQLVRFRSQMSGPDMQDVSAQSRTLSALSGYSKLDLDYTQKIPAERIKGSTITQSMLPMLGVQPEMGRWFRPEEAKPGSEHLIIISHGFWESHLGADPQVIGRQLSFTGATYTVIGVMPAGFQLPQDDVQVWTLITSEYPEVLPYRGAHTLRAYGRLRPGATLQEARAELNTVAQRLARAYPVENTDTQFVPIPLHDYAVQDFRTGLLLLFAAVALVLLIGCVNIANLLLTRATGRQREISVRVALGAGSRRLIRQFLAESLLLGAMGGAAALLLAVWMDRMLILFGSDVIARLDQARIDPGVLAFNFGLALLTAFVFGLLPAFSITREDIHPLKAATSFSAGPHRRKLRSVLVAAEIAMAMVLLVGAGLLLRSFQHLLSVSPGFEPDHLLTANLWLPTKQYRDIDKRTIFFQQVHDKLQAIPGVTAAGGTTEVPFGDNHVAHNLIVAGRAPLPQGTEPEIYYRGITPDYLSAMKIPLLKGRGFTAADSRDSQPVAIVNQSMARQLFPDEDPIGKQVRWAREESVRWITIVGIAGDVHSFGLTQPDQPAVYIPYTQEHNWWRTWMTFVLRSDLPVSQLEASVREAVAQVDKNIAVAEIRTMDERMDNASANRRFQLLLFGLFAVIALILAAVGTYGVVSYLVSQRTREIGVRIAVGAQRGDVLALVLREGMLQVLMGMAVGLIASLALSRLLNALLFQTPPADPATLLAVSVLLGAVAMLASYIPARHAARVDPMVALRYE